MGVAVIRAVNLDDASSWYVSTCLCVCLAIQSELSFEWELPGKSYRSSSSKALNTPQLTSLTTFLPRSGCQAYIIREGWEGLVRGNNTDHTEETSTPNPSQPPTPALSRSTSHVHLPPSQRIAKHNKVTERKAYFTEAGEPLGHLSYGFGDLLLSGSAEGETEMDGMEDGMMGHVSGVVQEQAGVEGSKKTLKGTYIVRVGWDDVRGWLGEVSGQAWGCKHLIRGKSGLMRIVGGAF